MSEEPKIQEVIEENKEQWYFSLFSGEIYSTTSNEPQDAFQIPLKSKPDPMKNCKKCYGRLHVGYNITHKHYMPCTKCLKKYTDVQKLGRKLR